MTSLQDRLKNLRPYVVGIRFVKDMPVVDVNIKDGWKILSNDKITINRSEKTKNYLMFYSENSSVEIDEILDFVEFNKSRREGGTNMNLILFVLTCYGISNIVIYGSIFESFRKYWEKVSPKFFGKLFKCMICLPTYVGFFISIGAHVTGHLQFSPFASMGLSIDYISIFLDGCLASGSVWLIHTYQEYLERK